MLNSLRSEYLKFFYNPWLSGTAVTTILLVPMMILYLHESPKIVNESYVWE